MVAGSRRLRVWDVGRHNEPLDQVADIGYQNIAAVWSKRDRAHLKFADRSTTTFEASPSDVEQFVELVRSAMGGPHAVREESLMRRELVDLVTRRGKWLRMIKERQKGSR